MNIPLISIIVPIYNVEKYIRRALDRILSQTFQDFEVILVDDGSPDNCPVICDEYCLLDNRFKVIHQVNKGLSGARNAGMKAANGVYITFCDPDDYYKDNNALQNYASAVQHITKQKVLFCSGYLSLTGDNITENIPSYYESLLSVKDGVIVMEENNLCGFTWNKLYLREIIVNNHLQFNENYSAHEDKLFLIQYLRFIEKIFIISIPIYCYVIRQSSLSYSLKNITKRVEALNQVMEESNCLRKDLYLNIAETRWCGAWLKSYTKTTFDIKNRKYYTNRERLLVLHTFIKVSIRYIFLLISKIIK